MPSDMEIGKMPSADIDKASLDQDSLAYMPRGMIDKTLFVR